MNDLTRPGSMRTDTLRKADAPATVALEDGELLAALVNAEPLPLDARLTRAMGTARLEK